MPHECRVARRPVGNCLTGVLGVPRGRRRVGVVFAQRGGGVQPRRIKDGLPPGLDRSGVAVILGCLGGPSSQRRPWMARFARSAGATAIALAAALLFTTAALAA